MDVVFCFCDRCKHAGKGKGFKSDSFDNRDTQTTESEEDEDFLHTAAAVQPAFVFRKGESL